MEKEILADAIKLVTKDCKDDVDKSKSYNQYLNDMTEKQLDNIISLYSSMQYDDNELDLMYVILKEDNKDRKVRFLLSNLSKIIDLELEVFITDLIKDTIKIIKNDGYMEYDIKDLEIFINHIIVLKKLGFIFVNIQSGKIKIHMPETILKIVKDKIASMENNDINIEKENINKFIVGFLNAYGMMSITEAYILITKLYKNISPEFFNRYIFLTANVVHTQFKADDVYIYNINLLDEEIPELEDIHSKLEYNFYSLDEIKLLATNEYYTRYMQYNVLKEFVETHLDISMNIIKFEIVDWYIILAQMDEEDAENYIEQKISEFDIKEKYKMQMKEYIRKVYEICPKWKLKGAIKYKKNNDIKILKFPK
ncbi:MAG: hypothetical protein J6D03_01885 [Clostridia bacterium]|nr:hypothetical protein [Clostridia bacterium]